MRSRLQLWHAFDAQLHLLLPDIHRARLHVLALLTLGLLWAEAVAVPRIARTLPLTAKQASIEKRLARFLANPKVAVAPLWAGLLPSLLADRAGTAIDLVFDPTPHNGRFTILALGLVDRSRVLPVAWRVVPQQTPWPDSQLAILTQLCTAVDRALPPGCRVTLLADRGITGPAVIALCRSLGWGFVLRLSVSARQTNRVRVGAAPEQALWELVGGPGHRFTGPVQLFKEAGWLAVELTITWPRRYAEPWVLVSDQPAGPAIARLPPPRPGRGHLPGRQNPRLAPGSQQARPGRAVRPPAARPPPRALVGAAARPPGDPRRAPRALRPRRPPRPGGVPPRPGAPPPRTPPRSLSAPALSCHPRPLGLHLVLLTCVRERTPSPSPA